MISGGTFTSEVPLAYCADGFIPEATDDGSGGYTYGVKSTEGYVAALVDEAGVYTCYATLNDTLTAAAALAYQGKVANIVLLDDITGTEDQYINIAAGMTVTLDLNGQALIGINKGPFIQNHGTLTINDNKGTGRVYTTDVSAQGRAAIANYGTLTINGGYYGDSDNDTTNANSIQRGNALRNYGTATINGGYFTVCDNYTNGGYAYPIANGSSSYPDASLTINYATVYGKVNGVLAADSGTLIVKDGSYTLGYGTETNLFYMIYASGEACVTVAGGEFFRNVNNNYGFFCADDTGAKITISGGTFENRIDGKTIDFVGSGAINVTAGNFGDAVAKGASATVSVAISGGTFTSEVPLALCADGYQSKEQENGTFAVEKMLVYAKNYANSLLIEDIISIRYYFNIESDTYTDEYIAANGGILVWTAEAGDIYTPETASYSIAGLTVWNDENGKHYYATSNGIPAKNMGDVQYACVYVKNTDETYYYSEAFGYSPVTYATNKLASEASSDSLKAFLVSMLNYGAAAQLHFNYNTENLVNSILTEEQKSWSWDDSLLISLKDDSAGKFSFASDALITLKGWSLSCEGATEINLYSVIDPSLTADAKKMVLLYWSEDAYNSAVTLTAENASGEVVLVYSEEQAAYKGKIKGIAAKDLGDTYYACVCVVGADDTYHYSQLGIYSAHTYVLNKLSSEDATEYLKDLCKTMAIYSDKAKAYFAE